MATGSAIPGKPITEDTLIEKAVFAFLSHSEIYQRARAVDLLPGGGVHEQMVKICNLLHKAIKLGAYNRDYHAWIEAEGSSDLIPERFNGISKQLRTEAPTYTNKKSSKFCHSFAAICLIANDILGSYYDEASSLHKRIREEAKLSSDATIGKDQMRVLGLITRELRSYAGETNPNWPVTYEAERPIVKTNLQKYFLSSSAARDESVRISGRFICYREAFSKSYGSLAQDYLVVKQHPSGCIFNWTVFNGAEGTTKTFNGVVYFLKDTVCLQGYCFEPFPRMRFMTVGLRSWREHLSEQAPQGYFIGELITTKLLRGTVVPASSRVIISAERRGDFQEDDYTARARYISEEQLCTALGDEALGALVK